MRLDVTSNLYSVAQCIWWLNLLLSDERISMTWAPFILFPESHPDAFPNLLTPSDSFLQLIDSGLSINIGCAPVLRPEREVDVLICFDNSWTPNDIFKVKVNLFQGNARPLYLYSTYHTQGNSMWFTVKSIKKHWRYSRSGENKSSLLKWLNFF